MRHAKTFVKVSSQPAVPAPSAVEGSSVERSPAATPAPAEVSDQTSEVSAEEAADAPPLTSDIQLLTSDSPPQTSHPIAPDDGGDHEARPLFDAMHCPDRRRVLRTLCALGRCNTQTLLRALAGLHYKSLCRHLTDLRRLGFIDSRQIGLRTWHRCEPGLVSLTRDKRGRDALCLSLPSGTQLILAVPGPAPAPPPIASAPPTRADANNPVD